VRSFFLNGKAEILEVSVSQKILIEKNIIKMLHP